MRVVERREVVVVEFVAGGRGLVDIWEGPVKVMTTNLGWDYEGVVLEEGQREDTFHLRFSRPLPVEGVELPKCT